MKKYVTDSGFYEDDGYGYGRDKYDSEKSFTKNEQSNLFFHRLMIVLFCYKEIAGNYENHNKDVFGNDKNKHAEIFRNNAIWEDTKVRFGSDTYNDIDKHFRKNDKEEKQSFMNEAYFELKILAQNLRTKKSIARTDVESTLTYFSDKPYHIVYNTLMQPDKNLYSELSKDVLFNGIFEKLKKIIEEKPKK